MSQTHPYVVIAGSGRSGTNRLLDAFDLHPETVCRSEPEEMIGGDFRTLPGAHRRETRWAMILRSAGRAPSAARDGAKVLATGLTRSTKATIRFHLMSRLVQKMLARRRVRGDMLGKVFPGLRGIE
jgi:hypothetical protein